MRRLLILSLLPVLLIGLWGCSDKQKEADRLEQEVQDMETPDTVMVEPEVDTTATTPQADATAVPAETEPDLGDMPPAPPGPGYTVQVSSTASEAYARKLVDLYTQRGYEPFVTTITYKNETYWRIRIGKFEYFSQAQALKKEIVDRFSVQGVWVDELD